MSPLFTSAPTKHVACPLLSAPCPIMLPVLLTNIIRSTIARLLLLPVLVAHLHQLHVAHLHQLHVAHLHQLHVTHPHLPPLPDVANPRLRTERDKNDVHKVYKKLTEIFEWLAEYNNFWPAAVCLQGKLHNSGARR
ncbi:hypothetical protein B0H10DRAFT_2215818 [Mycena sp. CBHHK59/15]|nr:hypothetical protein B0H10DRAFT_2215818 [Mycena sp. CBHHK59/15]